MDEFKKIKKTLIDLYLQVKINKIKNVKILI